MPQQRVLLLLAAVASAGLTIAADLLTPRGFVGGVLGYFIAILLAAWLPWRGTAYGFALLASVLSLIGYGLTAGGQPLLILVNRLLLIAAYWAMAFLVERRRNTERLLAESNRQLADRARQEQRDAAKRLQLIADSVPVVIGYIGTDERYRFVNARYQDLIGVSPEQAIGTSLEEVLGAEAYARIAPHFQVALAGREVSYETLVPTVHGERLLAVSYVPSRDQAGRIDGVVSLVQDVTEERERERQMRLMQRMESIGRLAGGIAHDFNNLLVVISGNLESLEQRLAQDPALAPLVGSALRATRRGTSLTEQLLSFSRPRGPQLDTCDPNQVIADTVDMLERTLGSGIEIAFAPDPRAGPIQVDAGELQNAILNLSINARDAMPEGGRLEISSRSLTLNPGAAAPTAELEPGDYVEIQVSDSGHGMEPAVVERAFEPFFTTKDVGKGTGLGLSLVHALLSRSGGVALLDSTAATGTTIKLFFPRTREAGSASRRDPAPEASAQTSGSIRNSS